MIQVNSEYLTKFNPSDHELAQSDLERISLGQATPGVSSSGQNGLCASVDNKTWTILEYQAISDQKQEAVQKLVKAGLKEDFATEVVENSGTTPNEIIKDPAGVLGEYWYANLNEAVDFLNDGIAVNAEELKRGLRALQFQDSVVDSVYSTRTPRPDWLAHRDIFSWADKLVTIRLLHNS